jgi:nucleoside-diphosphate-sugar epimerase
MSALALSIPKGLWVLVTGATGFVAGHVIRQLLQRGYKVRGTVCDTEKASRLIDDHFKSYAEKGDLELVEVPDMAVDGAFDEAVKAVTAVAHVAASTDLDPNPNNNVPHAVAGDESILKSTTRENSVKRFVFTSSIMAVALPLASNDVRGDRNTWNDVAVEAAWAPPPYEQTH